MVDENSIEYKYGAECFKVVRLKREVTALKAELAQQTANKQSVPCNQYKQQHSMVSVCPIGTFDCVDKPCMIVRRQ